MRNPFISIVILFLLAACAAPIPAPTATATISPTESPTAIPTFTFTPTVTFTPTPVVFDTELKPQYETPLIEIMDEYGAKVSIKIITDTTLEPMIAKIVFHEGWKNKEGLTSEQALAKFAAMSIYRVWTENGNTGTYEDYMAMLAAAQENGSVENWRKVKITAKVNDLTTEKYDAKPVTMFPFYVDKGVEVPSDVKVFRELNLGIIKAKKSNIDKVLLLDPYETTGGDFGYGASLSPDGIFYGHVGIVITDNNNVTLTWGMSRWSDFLASGSPRVMHSGYYYNSDMLSIIATKIREYCLSTSLQTFGPDGKLRKPEAKCNR